MGKVRKYLTVSEYFDRSFRFYAEIADGDVRIRIYCLDPSDIMDRLLTRAVSSVMFSATLTPPEYFCDVLGGQNRAVSVSLPSPFDPANLCVAVADYVSTRLEDREKNYARYAAIIAATVSPRHGNYIAYFPSYACMEGVLKVFARKYPKVETVVQATPASSDQTVTSKYTCS
jgi:DNA excision repair protein ERCC-2